MGKGTESGKFLEFVGARVSEVKVNHIFPLFSSYYHPGMLFLRLFLIFPFLLIRKNAKHTQRPKIHIVIHHKRVKIVQNERCPRSKDNN